MAPRRQAKQPATETVVAAADGNATPPKKRKIAAKPVTEKPKPVRTMASRAAKEKHNNNNNDVAVDEFAVPPKKSRGKTKTAPKSTAVAKTKTKKVNKQAEAAVDNNMDEELTEQQERKQIAEKKMRGKPAAKKAGTSKKPAATKSRVKKPQDEVAIENGAEDLEKDTGKKNSAKKTRRGGKAVEDVEKNDAPAANKVKPAAKSRKRKLAEDTEKDVIAEAEVAVNVEKMEMVPNKKSGGKSKKVETETSDAPEVKPRGKATKNSARVETAKPLSKEVEVKEQSDQSVEIEDDSKAKNAKNKRGNAKKATSRSKRNAAAEKTDDTPVEEAAPFETPEDVKENGDAETIHTTESKQTKKKNAGKTNAVTNEKAETKGRQKKGQTVTGDEKVTVKNEIIETVNLTLKASDENHVNNVTSNQNDSSEENEEENVDENNTSKMDSVKDEEIISKVDSEDTDVDTSFLCFN